MKISKWLGKTKETCISSISSACNDVIKAFVTLVAIKLATVVVTDVIQRIRVIAARASEREKDSKEAFLESIKEKQKQKYKEEQKRFEVWLKEIEEEEGKYNGL